MCGRPQLWEQQQRKKNKSEYGSAVVPSRETTDIDLKNNHIKNSQRTMLMGPYLWYIMIRCKVDTACLSFCLPRSWTADSDPSFSRKDQITNQQMCRTHWHKSQCQNGRLDKRKLNSSGWVLGISQIGLRDDTNLLQNASLHLVSFLCRSNNSLISKCWHLSFFSFFFVFARLDPNLRRQKCHL